MRKFLAYSAYLLLAVLIMLCMVKAKFQHDKNKRSSIENPYEHLKFHSPEFIPNLNSYDENTRFMQQLNDFYRLAVDARIYVIQYQPRYLPEAQMKKCFERSINVSELLPLSETEQLQCAQLRSQIEDRPRDHLIIEKKTSHPIIIIFQSDVPVVYSFDGTTSKVQMMLLSGQSYTGIEGSTFTRSGQAYSSRTPGLPFYANSYNKKYCDMCATTSIAYFKNHKTEAELKLAIYAYFNQPLYKIITVHEPSRIVLK